MKNLLFATVFMICLFGVSYGQSEQQDGIRVGISVRGDGQVKVGETIVREAPKQERREAPVREAPQRSGPPDRSGNGRGEAPGRPDRSGGRRDAPDRPDRSRGKKDN